MATSFVSVLNESYVTFIPDVTKYGWAVIDQNAIQSGYEAVSPDGEIKCFDTYKDANDWRLNEVRRHFNYINTHGLYY